MNKLLHFSSEDFLEDVKYAIKKKYKNQERFSHCLGLTRKRLNRILNDANSCSIENMNEFAVKLDLDIRNYIF